MNEGDPCSDPDCKGTMEYNPLPAENCSCTPETNCGACILKCLTDPARCNVCGSTETESEQ